VVLVFQPVDDWHELGVASLQVREHASVLERVVGTDDPAVLGAVGPERPVVLAHGHLADERPRGAEVNRALGNLLDQIAELGQFAAQAVVDVEEMLGGRLLLGRVAAAPSGSVGALRPRSVSTISRTAGATSSAKRRISSAELTDRM
jgi:hypothetical protein